MTVLSAWGVRWESRLDRWGDRLNPIVVREVRQSLQTRFFLSVFLLLLGGTWIVSSAMISSNSHALGHYEFGPEFFYVYAAGLLFCLLFVAPFGAYYSMVQEFRDRAFEVLAISTLTPTRIVNGKLQGALVMMLIYASAIAPYLCLSYLLGGLSLLTLGVTLLLLAVVSLGMCLFAVMLGALAQKPWIEVVNLLILIVVAMVVFAISIQVLEALIHSRWSLNEILTGLICFGVLAGFVAILSFAVAQSQLTTTYLPLTYRRYLPPAQEANPGVSPPAISSPNET